jgi:hypothetical protein
MNALVSVAVVKDRLRIDEPESEGDLQRMAEEASAIVLDYLKKPSDAWTEATVPSVVRSAILLVVRALYDGEDEPLSTTVKALVHRLRDPALA